MVISTFISTHPSGFNNAKIDQLGFKIALNDADIQMEKWGLEPNKMYGTFPIIGEDLGLSKERVRQIKDRNVNKLRWQQRRMEVTVS